MWMNAVGVLFIMVMCFTPAASADPFWMPKRQILLAGMLMLSMFAQTSENKVPLALSVLGAYAALLFTGTFLWDWRIGQPQLFPSLLGIITILFTLRLIQQATAYGLQRLATWVSVGIILMTAFCLLQYAGLSQWLRQPTEYTGARSQQMFGTLGNHMLVGNFLAMGAPLLLMFRRLRLLYPVVLLTIFLADNNAGLLATAISLCVWFLFTGRHLQFYITAVITLYGAGYAVLHLSDGGRLSMWASGIKLLITNQQGITGFGMGSVEYLFRSGIYSAVGLAPFHPHNELIFALMELGVIGAGLLIWLFYSTMRRLLYAQTSTLLAGYAAALAASLTICMFSFPTQVPPLLLLLLIGFCGTWSLTKESRYVSA